MAIYEGVYAYLFKKNYASENISLGEGIYTVSKNCGSGEVREMQAAFRAHGDIRLDRIDGREGVTENGAPVPDFGLSAYSYTPANGSSKLVLSRITLRKSIQNVTLRGTKALIHAVISDGLPRDVYAVDCTYDKLFEEYTDIPLEEATDIPENICEKRPSELTELDAGRFRSEPILARDIAGLCPNAFKKLSALVTAILAAKRDGRTLFVVHNVEENEFVRSMLRAALKVLPASLANSVSFVTASGSAGGVPRDVVCVPTRDDAAISALKRSGYVVQLHEGGAVPADVPANVFGEFFARADEDGVQRFLDCTPAYYEGVRKIQDLDVVMRLFNNKYFTDGEERRRQKPTEALSSQIRLIVDNFKLISDIRGELTEQVTGLSASVDALAGEFFSASPEEVMNAVLLPLVDLYKRCAAAGVAVSSDILRYLHQILFGYEGQNAECEKKHFRLLMNFSRLASALGGGRELLEQMQNDTGFLREFFTDFFTDGDYTETAMRIAYHLLGMLLADVQSRYGNAALLRDMLVEKYSDSADSRRMSELYLLIFRPETDVRDAFDYVTNVVFADDPDEKRHHDRLVSYGLFLCNPKQLEPAIKYYCEAVSGGMKQDDARVVLDVLLNSYLPRTDGTLDAIYAQFKKLTKLLDDICATQGLKVQLYDDFAKRVINPDYKKAIAAIRADRLTDAQKACCKEMAGEFGEGTLCSAVEAGFAEGLRSLVGRNERFLSQSELEGRLTGARVDFVVRELLLLDGKTIYKLFENYVPKPLCNAAYERYGLGRLAPYKNSEQFIAAAEEIARGFLNAPQANERAQDVPQANGKNKGKDAFIAAVKKERDDRNVDFRIHLADASRRLFESILVTAVMFLLAAVVSVLLYKYYEGGYFMSVYFAFPVLAAVASQILYWYNVRHNKTRNALLMSAWQSFAVTAGMMGVFVLMRAVLALVY